MKCTLTISRGQECGLSMVPRSGWLASPSNGRQNETLWVLHVCPACDGSAWDHDRQHPKFNKPRQT